MDEIKIKQQAIERIKKAEKILVTVSDSPSVDELSAALGLTLLLEKQEKYATAIFSGETPPAIAFLEPEKTFDDTTDSLRDFIIAINKDKADHLRMPKPEQGDKMVRIYVTPYKSVITGDDVQFEQGDYNVDLVIALGVDQQEHLDAALESHGQILHDADIITMTASDKTSDLGGIDWHDGQASSLSEMVAGLAEALKQDKTKSLLDASIATALLTGIVAQTDRFSNEHTTAKAMTVSATLMAAGADQQLIATELQVTSEPVQEEPAEEIVTDEEPEEAPEEIPTPPKPEKKKKNSNELTITHDRETLADLDKRVMGEEKAQEKVEAEIDAVEEGFEHKSPEPVETATASAYAAASAFASNEPKTVEPILGGTLNATTEQAADDARDAIENDQNRTILSHSYLGQSGQENTNVSEAPASEPAAGFPGTPAQTPGSEMFTEETPSEQVQAAYSFAEPTPEAGSVLSDALNATNQAPVAFGGERVIEPIHSQLSPNPVAPEPYAPQTQEAPVSAYGLPLPPPIPDFSQGIAPAPGIPLTAAPQSQPELLGDILAPEPAPLPVQPAGVYAPVEQPPVAPPAPQPTDPGQFKIPGQQ